MTDKDKDPEANTKSQAEHDKAATPQHKPLPPAEEDEAARYTPAELLELIGKAEVVEIGFTDDKGKELEGLPRQPVTGGKESWLATPNGLGLNVPKLQVGGPNPMGTPTHTIEGYALFLDGDEVAERKREKPLNVEPGMTFDLRGDMLF